MLPRHIKLVLLAVKISSGVLGNFSQTHTTKHIASVDMLVPLKAAPVLPVVCEP